MEACVGSVDERTIATPRRTKGAAHQPAVNAAYTTVAINTMKQKAPKKSDERRSLFGNFTVFFMDAWSCPRRFAHNPPNPGCPRDRGGEIGCLAAATLQAGRGHCSTPKAGRQI